MKHRKTPATIILLLDEHSASNNKFIKEWLGKSSFVINETNDVFQILEDLSDFTTRSRPNVVLLTVDSLEQDYFTIQNMMQTFSDSDDFPILALSDSGKVVNDKNCFEGNLAEVKAQITKVLPKTFAKPAPIV